MEIEQTVRPPGHYLDIRANILINDAHDLFHIPYDEISPSATGISVFYITLFFRGNAEYRLDALYDGAVFGPLFTGAGRQTSIGDHRPALLIKLTDFGQRRAADDPHGWQNYHSERLVTQPEASLFDTGPLQVIIVNNVKVSLVACQQFHQVIVGNLCLGGEITLPE